MVAFSSDDELIEALGHVAETGDGVFCVFAEEIDDEPFTPADCGHASNVRVLPRFHLLHTAAAACGPLIHGLLSASEPNRGAERKTADDDDTKSNQRETDSSCFGEAAAADGKRCAGSEAADSAETTNRRPSASRHVDDGNRAASEFLTNIVHGLGAMLNTYGMKKITINCLYAARAKKTMAFETQVLISDALTVNCKLIRATVKRKWSNTALCLRVKTTF
jgi:hypothetical protein